MEILGGGWDGGGGGVADKHLLKWKLQGVGNLKEKCPPTGMDIFWKLHNTSTLKYRQWTLMSCLINRYS